ncbi:SGNH/GDSL hydrolase family protein [Polaribacter sp. M15]
MHLNKIPTHHFFLFISLFIFACTTDSELEIIKNNDVTVEEIVNNHLKILSLGDSYTIGESVCEKCTYPAQLVDSLQRRNNGIKFNLKVIATTGWTTRNLINAIDKEDLSTDFDLVTLLIGVNNQYQGLPFSTFQEEFPILINKAHRSVNFDKTKIIVLSIPDYAFTPFGNGSETVSKELEQYNSHIKKFCESRNITFLNITDITQAGLAYPNYVASDGLHPSTEAYTEFVKRLLPIATQKLSL